ncbi:hypothetical protein TURU_127037 [Turdus rufiventris]|nr:hypothetical protein TURU_127037 [Turdus rufiventris]
MGLFECGDLDESHVSDHDKPIREKLLAYPWMKVLLRGGVNGESDFKMAPQRRLAYDADFNLKAINHTKEHGNRSAAREFNINESMVCKWRKQEHDLRLAKKMKKSFHGNKVRWPQLENRLDHWISKQRAVGRSFSTVIVWIKAKVMANEMDINDFKSGPSWCFHFMKQWQLSIRTRMMVSQQLPVDYEEKLTYFWSYCESKISEKNIQPDHIINMDKVPLALICR